MGTRNRTSRDAEPGFERGRVLRPVRRMGGAPRQPSAVLRVLLAAGGDLADPRRRRRGRHTLVQHVLDATYQLEINTTTTIITFLMVALLQNSQTRDNQAVQHKLNAIADGVADLMEHVSDRHDDDDLMHDVEELRDAVGLESRESTSHNLTPPSPPGVSTPPPTGI